MARQAETSFASSEQRVGAGGRRLAYIDGMRGVSAAYVVLFHMYQFANARFAGTPPTWWKASTVFNYGDCGVAVFIVVSGYCLMLPVVANEGLELKGGRRRFALRRLRRLGPGYVAALVGSSILILLVPSLRHRSGTTWDASLPAFGVGTIVAHVLLVYNWSRTWRYEIDTPMWTVALEVQIYAVFVFGLLPLWRRTIGRRPNVVVVGACALVTVVLMAVGLSWAQPWMLLLFALGMCAAEASARPVGWMRGHVDLLVLAALAATVVTFSLERRFLHSYDSVVFVREVVVGIAAALLLLALRQASPADGRLTLRIGAALSTRPLTWLGEISYSLYLVHFPIIGAIALTWVYGGRFGVPENFALIVVVGGAVSLAGAAAFHRLFERSYLSPRQSAIAGT
ncbi:MAG: acyltransferase 3 [Ilumatobacteraceae bacterium]|nr:acyltransferase 3 [Ilumatobacteraceae bacterium]